MNTSTVARICCFLQLHRVAYFLNRKRKRVITFHNVLSDDIYTPNVANGVSCSFTQFKTIIESIGKRFKFSLDLDDASTATITFDDGYDNQATVAAPYLIERGIPAYLFVSGQLLNSTNDELTIDKLLHWVSYAPDGLYQISIIDETISFELKSENRQKIWSQIIWPTFIADCGAKGNNVLKALDSAYPYNSIRNGLSADYASQRLAGVTSLHLKILKDQGWQIGWHTRSHYPVAKLSTNEKVEELTWDEEIDSPVMSFPYGGIGDVDVESIEIVKKLGYQGAMSNINLKNKLSGNYFRSRMSLPNDPYLIDFELSGLKYFLKYKKLLPKL